LGNLPVIPHELTLRLRISFRKGGIAQKYCLLKAGESRRCERFQVSTSLINTLLQQVLAVSVGQNRFSGL
jgi:hypothetical protein